MNNADKKLFFVVITGIWTGWITDFGAARVSDRSAEAAGGQSVFYVAVDGRDDNPGTADKPFATPARAQQVMRERGGQQGRLDANGATVMIRGGTYFLSQPWVLTSADSGTADKPVTYQAAPGEKVILSGGCRITDWSVYKDTILQARLPEAVTRQPCLRQLFLDGRRMTRARWPNAASDPIGGEWALVEKPAQPDSHIAFVYQASPAKKSWAKPRLGEVNVYPFYGWCNNIVPIEDVNPETRTITLQREIWRSDADFARYANMPFREGNRFIVENMLEELDQPGEWCVDPQAGMIYFWPPNPLTADSQVVIPMLDCLIDFQPGASHIVLDGLTLTATTTGDNYHRFGLMGYGAMFPIPGWRYCGEAVRLKDAAYCTIRNCGFVGLGGNAVYLEQGAFRNEITRCRFTDVSANGVCLLGTRESHPRFNRIEDNTFDHCGTLLKYVAAVFAGVSDGNLIAHNAIADMPHHAINLATNGLGRNYIEYNDIRRTCRELHDNGAINSWMDQRDESNVYIQRDAPRCGHVIRYNYIADTLGKPRPGEKPDPRHNLTWGIYLDDYTSNCIVFGNVIVRSGTGLCVHAGRNNLIENNIIDQCNVGQRFQDCCYNRPESPCMQDFNTGNRYRNNIVCTAPESPWLFCLHNFDDKTLVESDDNLFYNPDGQYRLVQFPSPKGEDKEFDLTDWRAMGYDRRSITADPMFVDPAQGDYRLKPDSPALKLGFQPIPLDRIGPRPAKN